MARENGYITVKCLSRYLHNKLLVSLFDVLHTCATCSNITNIFVMEISLTYFTFKRSKLAWKSMILR